MNRDIPQVFVDMDGVLADFDSHYEAVFGIRPDKVKDNVDWSKVREVPGFYANIPLMPDAMELWGFVSQLRKKPIILTGIPKSIAAAAEDKMEMAARYFKNTTVITCASREKSLFAKPGDILIDDWDRYRDLWIQKGGRWVTHTSAEDSITQLLELGVGL